MLVVSSRFSTGNWILQNHIFRDSVNSVFFALPYFLQRIYSKKRHGDY